MLLYGIIAVGAVCFLRVLCAIEVNNVQPSRQRRQWSATEEYDSAVREKVKVSVYTRPLESSKECESEHMRHWVLVFYFSKSNRYIQYEATAKNGKLVMLCFQEPPRAVNGYNLYENVAECEMSPRKLHWLASCVELNNQPYNCFSRNCQEWVKLFAKSIGGEVWKTIDRKFKTFYELNPDCARLLGALETLDVLKSLPTSGSAPLSKSKYKTH